MTLQEHKTQEEVITPQVATEVVGGMTHTGPAGKSGLGDRIRLNNKFSSSVAENIIDSNP